MIDTHQTGVYMIKNRTTGKFYVGSTSSSFKKRIYHHKLHLNRGTHDSRYMQNAWNKYGADDFKFSVLVICAKDMCLFYEQLFLDALSPAYNTAKVAGSILGVKLSEETRKKFSKLKREQYARHDWKGKIRSLAEIAEMEGIDYKMLISRVSGLGRTVAEAVAEPYKGAVRLLTHNGETRSVKGWAEHLGVHKQRIHSRINRGWTIGECIKFFDGYEKKMSIQEYCKTLGLQYTTVVNRLARGYALSDASNTSDMRTIEHKYKEAA